MSRTSSITSVLSLALALTLGAATMGLAQDINGTYWENGGHTTVASAVRAPNGYHMGPACGSTYENGTVGLSEGVKGAVALPTQNLGDRGDHYGPMNGSDYQNMR